VGFTESPYRIIMPVYQTDLMKLILNEHATLTSLECFQISKEIAEAMTALHDLGVIHLDLKPQNILINVVEDNIHPVITDFGKIFFLYLFPFIVKE